MPKFRKQLTAAAILVGASLPFTGANAPAAAGASAAGAATKCVSDNGTDVNRYFVLYRADAIWLNLQGLRPACVTVRQGRTFVRAHGWITQLPPGTVVEGRTVEPTYPEGYVPDRAAPMDDFLSKIVQARYVISRDGEVELARIVNRRHLLDRAKLGRFGDLFVAPDTTLVPGVTIHRASPEWTTLEPFTSRRLDIGSYTVDIYWTLAEQHCDGFTTDVANDCLPAGESRVTSTNFDVVR
ncbi:hypothetical protein AB0M20_29285 [Actinoplanes sp. NPDC051633]|uniref:hypothetical protein n=1 Tax=Actinoplanes sp. NPDC051633 TaxID=3155670 RepID=UPI00342D9F1C